MKPTELPGLTPGMKISDGKRTLEVLHVHTIDNDGDGSAAADAVVFAAEDGITVTVVNEPSQLGDPDYRGDKWTGKFSVHDPRREKTAIISATNAYHWSIV